MLDVCREVLRVDIPNEKILYKTSIMWEGVNIFFPFCLKYENQEIQTPFPNGLLDFTSLDSKVLCPISHPDSLLEKYNWIVIGRQEII